MPVPNNTAWWHCPSSALLDYRSHGYSFSGGTCQLQGKHCVEAVRNPLTAVHHSVSTPNDLFTSHSYRNELNGNERASSIQRYRGHVNAALDTSLIEVNIKRLLPTLHISGLLRRGNGKWIEG